MKIHDRWVVAALTTGLLFLPACSAHDSHSGHAEHPAEVEHIEGSDLSRVTLTEKASVRIGLETASVSEEGSDDAKRTVVPYSSLIYDPNGKTWIYTSPSPRTFIRAQVVVDRIDGTKVYLREGPPAGTVVASVGVAEIYGTEFEVGH